MLLLGRRCAVVCAGTCAAGVLIVAGCTGSGSGAQGDGGAGSADPRGGAATSAGSTRPVPTASSAGTAREQAVEAYLGMWRDMAEAGKTSDWDSPGLARHATGGALSVISRSLYADHLNGLVSKGEPKNYPKVTKVDPSANPTTVMISDCGDSTHWLMYRKDTGELADDKPGGRRDITAEVKRQKGGGWKVTRFAVWEVGSC